MVIEYIAITPFPEILISRNDKKTYQTPFKNEKVPVLGHFKLKIPQNAGYCYNSLTKTAIS